MTPYDWLELRSSSWVYERAARCERRSRLPGRIHLTAIMRARRSPRRCWFGRLGLSLGGLLEIMQNGTARAGRRWQDAALDTVHGVHMIDEL